MPRYYDGDVSTGPIVLKSIDGQRQLNITNQVVSIDIYESILSPVILGDMYVYDPLDLLQSFPVKGEEYVVFEWKIAGDKKGRKEKLIVTEVVGIEQEEDNRSKMYVLRLASFDLYESQKTLISKKYKANSVEIVKDIFLGLRSDKPIIADYTRGIDDVTITQLHPFEAIDFVRRRSISQRHKSSSFVFYEDKDAYHFQTLESVFEYNRKHVGDRVYFYSPDANVDVRQFNYRNILAYEHKAFASTFDQIQQGGLHNNVVSFDMITGELKNTTYKNVDYQKIDPKGTDLHTATFKKKYGDTSAAMFFTTVDGSLPTYELPDKIGQLRGFVHNITSNLLWMEVYGDTATTVGNVVEVHLPEATGLTRPKDEHSMICGNYLIAKCRHIIVFGNTRYYTQSMELIKGSYLE